MAIGLDVEWGVEYNDLRGGPHESGPSFTVWKDERGT